MTASPPQGAIAAETRQIIAADGFAIAATVHRPTATAARAVLMLNSAMGAPRRFYAPFARFVAQHGFIVVTYDYRGMGDSRPGAWRSLNVNLEDWGVRDQQVVIEYSRALLPGAPLVIVGQSVGGQMLGIAPGVLDAQAIVGVTAQSGHWRHWDGATRLGLWALWYIFIPSLSRLCGFFPGALFGLGSSLPKGVALQWAAWGKRPEYVCDPVVGPKNRYFDRIRAPVLSIGIEHDSFAPPRAVRAFRRWFVHAPLTAVDIPARARLGHFGWFREGRGEPFWLEMIEWVKRSVPGLVA